MVGSKGSRWKQSGSEPSRSAAAGSGQQPAWLLLAPVIFLLLWSAGYSSVKIGLEWVGPFYLLALRYFLVLAVLIPAMVVLRPPMPVGATAWRHLIVVGLLIQGLYFGATNLAIGVGASAAGMGIILALQPILVALLAPRLANESVSGYAWIGLVLGVTGAVVAILAKSQIGDATFLGILVSGVAVILITAGTLYEKRFGVDQHPVVANTIQCAVGLAVIFPVAFAFEEWRFTWTWPLVLSLLYSAICNSIVAMTLLFAMIRHGAASRASALLFLVPPTSAAMAKYFFGEEMPAAAWLGMAIAAVGVVMVRRG